MHTRHWITLGLVLALSLPTAAAAGEAEDKALASQIANNIRDSGELSNFRIGVKIDDGTAVLLGEVTDSAQANAAVEVAKRVAGVERVSSRLQFTDQVASPASNALHVEAAAPQRAAGVSEDSGLLLSLGNGLDSQEPTIIQTQSIRKPSKRVVAKKLKKPAREPNLKRVASRPPAPQQLTQPRGSAAQQAPRQVAMNRQMPRNTMPRPMAWSGQQGQRPVQAANYGGAARPAGYQQSGAQGGYQSPNMPGYAWPSYAAPQNYSALTYPKQYSPSAWPYIGPFYPYPQVPLGWRKVALEWDDGWWFLDFSHHQSH